MLLGAVADDLTGATDLSLTLAREGMETLLAIGVPPVTLDFGSADAVVVALKSRTVPANVAVAASRQAAIWLHQAGARQIIFKYCSTFDSTADGNIGPVVEDLMELLDVPFTIACPAFPTNGRTVYKGHLFVGDLLLSESSMKDHPLTPMRDADLVRVLQQQMNVPVERLSLDVVRQGPEALTRVFDVLAGKGRRIAIVDAITDDDLRAIGEASARLTLITGSSGVAVGLPDSFRKSGHLGRGAAGKPFDLPTGPAVVLAGSCSAATRRQVETAIRAGAPALKIAPGGIFSGATTPDKVAAWVRSSAAGSQLPPLVYSSADADEVQQAQSVLGLYEAGQLVEDFLAAVARNLQSGGFRRFLVAGGETSGAVVASLGINALKIGPEIDPGVPWTMSVQDEAAFALALKSGNFGTDDFFLKAWRVADECNS